MTHGCLSPLKRRCISSDNSHPTRHALHSALLLHLAQLTLLNGSTPALGWPTHRVLHGSCMAHVLPNRTRMLPEGTFGYYSDGCQLRWKGPCWDDRRGRNLRRVCTLDYRIDHANTRLTFQWHATSRPQAMALLTRRLKRMRTASGGPPDLVFASTGTWDMLSGRLVDANGQPRGECCCTHVAATLSRIADALTHPGELPPLRVLYGFYTCPSCSGRAPITGCAHWSATPIIEHFTKRTQVCARVTAATAGWLYLDAQQLTSRLPIGILGSPCGNQHPFGILADAQASILTSLASSAMRTGVLPPIRHDATDRQGLYGASWPASATHCSSSLSCRPSALVLQYAAEQQHLLHIIRTSRAYPGAVAGYCAETTGLGDCSSGRKGSWNTHEHGITGMADCMAKCRGCRNCHFISLSLAHAHRDCSWFQSCDFNGLHPPPDTGLDYTSIAVGDFAVGGIALPEPEPVRKAHSAIQV